MAFAPDLFHEKTAAIESEAKVLAKTEEVNEAVDALSKHLHAAGRPATIHTYPRDRALVLGAKCEEGLQRKRLPNSRGPGLSLS